MHPLIQTPQGGSLAPAEMSNGSWQPTGGRPAAENYRLRMRRKSVIISDRPARAIRESPLRSCERGADRFLEGFEVFVLEGDGVEVLQIRFLQIALLHVALGDALG